MENFNEHLFWRCLHRHAVLLAPLFARLNANYFAPDRDLIARAALARTMPELNEEIRGFIDDVRNRCWLRRRGRVRVSTRRLRREARPFLAGNTTPR